MNSGANQSNNAYNIDLFSGEESKGAAPADNAMMVDE